MNHIHRLLLDGDQKTRREVCWVLSNIAAGTSSQIEAIFDAGIIPSLIQILKTETFQVRSEVIFHCYDNLLFIVLHGIIFEIFSHQNWGFKKNKFDIGRSKHRKFSTHWNAFSVGKVLHEG